MVFYGCLVSVDCTSSGHGCSLISMIVMINVIKGVKKREALLIVSTNLIKKCVGYVIVCQR